MVTIINTDKYIYLGNAPIETKYYGKMFYPNGSSYQGYFLNKLKNGYGEQKNIDSYYKGYWKDDKYHGAGIFFNLKDQSYMTGYYQEGLLEGECLFYDKNMSLVNKALFKNGKSCVPTYEIIMDEKNKNLKKYEGFMFNGKYNGFGKLYDNNRIYIGNFISDKKDGKFLICNKDGTLVYSPESNIKEMVVDIEKVTSDNVINYVNIGTVNFSNDSLDDNHRLVYKERQIVKYIGKLNMDMKFHDSQGIYFENGNKFSGVFEDGKFISGTLTTQEGEIKGEFNDRMLHGKATLVNDKYSFSGEFVNNVALNGDLLFKYNGTTASGLIKCNGTYNTEHFVVDVPNPSSLLIEHSSTSSELYKGQIKIVMSHKLDVKVNVINAKHYLNHTLVYEGDFKNMMYNGSGIKYHPNGNINASGKFLDGDTSRCEYFDDTGNLIYSDEGVYNEENIQNLQNNQNEQDNDVDMPPLVSMNQLIQMQNDEMNAQINVQINANNQINFNMVIQDNDLQNEDMHDGDDEDIDNSD